MSTKRNLYWFTIARVLKRERHSALIQYRVGGIIAERKMYNVIRFIFVHRMCIISQLLNMGCYVEIT